MNGVLTEVGVYMGVVFAVGVTGFMLYRLVRKHICNPTGSPPQNQHQ